jgi:hypothetical protein
MHFQHTKYDVMMLLNMSRMKEMLKQFNRLKTDARGHAAACVWLQSGA